MEQYANGDRQSDLVDLASITGLPIDFIHTSEDESECPVSYAEDLYESIGTTDKAFFTVEAGGMHLFEGELPEETIDELVNLIENGQLDTEKFPSNFWLNRHGYGFEAYHYECDPDVEDCSDDD